MKSPRLRNWLFFRLERLADKGPFATVLLVLGFVGLIALVGGLAAFVFDREEFESLHEAIWWSTLRVSDPGYLEDDGGGGRPVGLSLVLSLSGAAFLFGGVAAVMTQWLTATLRHLAEGTTPVSFRDHFVVIGWTDRTPSIVAELLRAEPRTRVVVLLPEITELHRSELATALPHRRLTKRVVTRSGLPNRAEHLQRAACARARAILIPETGAVSVSLREFGPRWLSGLATLRKVLDTADPDARPHVVVELGRPEMAPLASPLLPGAEWIEGDRIAAAALARALDLDGKDRRVLVVGASGSIPELLEEFRRRGGISKVTLVLPEESHDELAGLESNSVDGGPTVEVQWVRSDDPGFARGLDLKAYDRFLLLADRGQPSAERADEGTLADAIALAGLHPAVGKEQLLVVELLDHRSARILEGPRLVASVTPQEVARALAVRALTERV